MMPNTFIGDERKTITLKFKSKLERQVQNYFQ